MARFNEILAGHFNRGLFKLLAMKGEAPAPQIASEITPVLPLPLGVEYRVLDSWDRWGALFSVNAVAAQFGQAQLRNPTLSNSVAVIEKITVVGQATTAVNVGIVATTVDNATILNPRPLDQRNPRANGSSVPSQATVVGGSAAQIYVAPAIASVQDIILTDDQEITLTPGFAIFLQNAVVNLSLTVALWWRERFLEDSERTA